MADTTTANYAFVKPEVGASADTWGAKWNANADALDARIKTATDAGNAAMPKAGGAFTGPVTSSGTIQASGGFTGNLTGTASAATLAAKASALADGGGNGGAITFSYAGQSGQPSFLWGTNNGSLVQVYNPSNFSVASAAALTAGSKTINGAINVTGAMNPFYDGSSDFSIFQTGSPGTITRTINFTGGRYVTWTQSNDTLSMGCGPTGITLSSSGQMTVTGNLVVTGNLHAANYP